MYIILSPNNVQNMFWQSGNDSKWFLNFFFEKSLMARETPSPTLYGKCHKKCPYFFWKLPLWSWILTEILRLRLVNILKFKFSLDADVWLTFWSWCLVEIPVMTFVQDLCKNHSIHGSVVPLAMVYYDELAGICLWDLIVVMSWQW